MEKVRLTNRKAVSILSGGIINGLVDFRMSGSGSSGMDAGYACDWIGGTGDEVEKYSRYFVESRP